MDESKKMDHHQVTENENPNAEVQFPPVSFDEFTPPTYEEWKEAAEALLKGRPFDKAMYTKTYEGITFEPMYTRERTDEILPTKSYPGMKDFLRGAKESGYINQPWGIAQLCNETLPQDNNELLKEESKKGSTVYNIALDSATILNKDAKDAEKIGDLGVNITTLEDAETLIDGLDFETHPVYMYAGASALGILALIAAALKKQGKKPAQLKGVIGANPIAQLLVRGKSYASLDHLYDEMAHVIQWANKEAPELRTIMVRSDVFSRAGANDVQEVAYTMSMAVAYVRAMLQRGFTIKEIARQIKFGFSMGANFFMQISKLRAMRVVWANIIEAFGGDEDDQRMLVHGRPAAFTKTIYDPYVNMLRDTTQIFSGVVGGIDTFEVSPFDEPIRKGDVFSRRISRNIQVMLQEEFGMLQPIDPAGGSWAVESLTKQLQEKIWDEFQKIEGMGGIVAALQENYPQDAINDILEQRFKSLELRKDVAVGNNMYPNMTEVLLDKRPEDTAALQKERSEKVAAYTQAKNPKTEIDALLSAISGEEGALVDAAIACFEAGATIGQMRQALVVEGDVSEEVKPLPAHRWTERFEELRMTTEKYKEEHDGDNVKVFLANMGPIPQHKARADFSTGFLQVGAFDVMLNDGFPDTDEAAKAAGESGADAVVICSTDKTYPDIVPELAPKLRAALPEATIFLAGAAPKDLEEIYLKAGVQDFISVKANCYQILRALQKKKGMIE